MITVFTNGCFDLFHPGHLYFLEQAHLHGDRVIVGMNTDLGYRAWKKHDPVFPFEERKKIVEALRIVYRVVGYDEMSPLSLIKKIRPRVLVQSEEYKFPITEEAKFVKSYGGVVAYVDRTTRWSSTELRRAVCA